MSLSALEVLSLYESMDMDDPLYNNILDDYEELSINKTSEGNQKKWISKDRKSFIKEQCCRDRLLQDYKVEVIAGILGSLLNTDIIVLKQEVVKLGNRWGVKSEYFHDTFISFYKISEKSGNTVNLHGMDVISIIDYIIDTVKKVCGIDITEYIMTMIGLDYTLLYMDRHFSNFGVFENNGTYKNAILFDNGLGLFEDGRIPISSLKVEVSNRRCKPFGINHRNVILSVLQSKYSSILKRIFDVELDLNLIKDFIPNKLAEEYLCGIKGDLLWQ